MNTVSTLVGIGGRPWVDLEPLLELGALPDVHEEICLALAQLPADYTGGSHRSMGIMPEGREAEALVDYVEVIRGLSEDAFERFRALSDRPSALSYARRDVTTFGEEREVPLSRRQMMWLKVRHGVYFPWKGYVELMPNARWEDKADPSGKRFSRIATTFFPKTLAFVRSLPFEHIGRCNVMGLEAHDHGTVHRDGDPADQAAPDEFITFCPNGDKALFLYDEGRDEEVPVTSRAYWFNDFDYHGVRAAPFFRYSVRVDGAFSPAFRSRLTELK